MWAVSIGVGDFHIPRPTCRHRAWVVSLDGLGGDALGDFQGAHMGVQQGLAPQELAVDADGARHLAGTNERTKVRLAIARVRGRAGRPKVGVPYGRERSLRTRLIGAALLFGS
jgi:hypothetical protein